MIGIYRITNKTNGKFYIGSSINVEKRWISHKCDLNKNRHPNPHLQNSFNLYGFDVFEFSVIEECSKEVLKEREQYYLDMYHGDKCYNIFKESYSVNGENHPMYGRKHTKESIEKIKKARAKQIIHHSKETKLKIGLSNKGRKAPIGHIEKMIKARSPIPYNKKNVDDKQIIQLYISGIGIRNMSEMIGESRDVIKRVLNENRIEIRTSAEQKNINKQNKK